ncbi:MAG: hypothetical protein AAF449_24160 [Myxococcota bacterium]
MTFNKILETYDESGAQDESIADNLALLIAARDELKAAMSENGAKFGAAYTEDVSSILQDENPRWFEENGSLHSAIGYAREITMIAGVTSDTVNVLLAND